MDAPAREQLATTVSGVRRQAPRRLRVLYEEERGVPHQAERNEQDHHQHPGERFEPTSAKHDEPLLDLR